MKRYIAAGVSILAVAAGVGWKLADQPENTGRLQQVSLVQDSEHSQPGPDGALKRVRVRVSPDNSGYEVRAKAQNVPQVSVTGQ